MSSSRSRGHQQGYPPQASTSSGQKYTNGHNLREHHHQSTGPYSHHGGGSHLQHLPTSLLQTVQHLIQLGAERNMQASQMQGLAGVNLAKHGTTFMSTTLAKLDKETEYCWVDAGRLAEAVEDWARALSPYETALRHNPFNVDALTQTANILRQQEKFVEAAEYFTRVIHLEEEAGEIWGALGHCYLMIDDLTKAYACYQQAIMHIADAKVSSLSCACMQLTL